MSLALTSVVVSAQGEAPGLRPAAALPSNADAGRARQKVAFEQRLNEQLPLDLPFKDEAGRSVKLGDYFGRKPVVLAFVYYECPMLCTQVLNGLESALRVIDESIGREFDVVTVSFDPRETPVLAAGKKKAYLDRYKRAERGARLAFPDRRAGVDRRADQGRRASASTGTSRRSSSRTRAASSWRRRRASCRAIFSASTIRRATSSSR